jgi:phospholipase/carboxylesterase
MRIAMREPDRFAGVVSLGGRYPSGSIRNVIQLRARRMPMLWQWGRQNPDFQTDLLKSDFRSLMAIGGQVEVRQYPGDDEMDTVVLADLNDWIMRRIVSGSAVTDSDCWATSPTAYSNN